MSGNPLLKFLDPPLYSVTLCIAGARSVLCVDEIKAVHKNLKFNVNYREINYHYIITESQLR